jgi:endonuclease/exonuclease/phosphatase family metal-dependent hydrolase
VSELARLEGARLIIGQLAAIAPDEPLVITGDFNCDPGTPPYQAFAEAGLVDCFLAAGGTDGPESLTFHGFKGRGYVLKDGRTERIDWRHSAATASAMRTRRATRATTIRCWRRWAMDYS